MERSTLPHIVFKMNLGSQMGNGKRLILLGLFDALPMIFQVGQFAWAKRQGHEDNMNNKQKQPNAERIRRFLERLRREQMFKKTMTWEDMGQAMQKPGPYERMRDEKLDPRTPTE